MRLLTSCRHLRGARRYVDRWTKSFSAILQLVAPMSEQQKEYAVPEVTCPEFGLEVSKSNFSKHWKFHRILHPEGEMMSRPYGIPVTQRQMTVPPILLQPGLIINTSIAASPTVASSIMCTTILTIQYTVAAQCASQAHWPLHWNKFDGYSSGQVPGNTWGQPSLFDNWPSHWSSNHSPAPCPM